MKKIGQILDPQIIEKAAVTNFPTPVVQETYTSTTKEEKVESIASHFRAIMEVLGLDMSDPSLQETPERVAKMYVHEIFSGLDTDNFPAINMFPRQPSSISHGDIVVTKTNFVSFCEHHFVPMIGTAHVGYIPDDRVIGLSKISRIVRYFAARPQLQERLSSQIGDCLSHLFEHDNIAVYIRAKHCCVIARGTKDETSDTTTLYTGGLFHSSNEVKMEFLHLIGRQTGIYEDL